jgi:UDP-GlcNAc:undecaprenyl-phosphate GlcNAc-1-phosphate transferase
MDFYAILLVATLLAAVGGTPVVRGLALRWGVLDRPGVRKLQKAPVPYLGGLALLAAFVAGAIAMVVLDANMRRRFGVELRPLAVLLAPAVLIFAVGLVDDVRGVRPRTKLLAQALAGTILCACGVRIESLSVSQTFVVELGPWSWPVTIAWIVSVSNALNLIDGLDGLASGIALIAAGTLAAVALHYDQRMIAGLALCVCGSLAGFLFFNFNPAKIYLGDSGSLLLGYLIGALTVMQTSAVAALNGPPPFASFAIPALALGVPIFDSLYSIVRRVVERRSPFAADKGHIHHRLLALGWRPVRVVLALWGISLASGGLALAMLLTQGARDLIVLASCLLLLALFFRFVGHVQVRPTLAALRHKQEFDRDLRLAQRAFESLQLQMQEARSFQEWWQLLCASAQQMDFARLELRLARRDGSHQTLAWEKELAADERAHLLAVDLPVRQRGAQEPLRLHAAIVARESLEAAGHRLALFARLLDERSLAELPDSA